MKKWFKRNWWSVIVSILSIMAICLVVFRIEPIDISNGTVISTVIGLMGICATIMVASQIMGLRMSEDKIKSILKEESMNLRESSHVSTVRALFRTEVLAAGISANNGTWGSFVYEIELLTSYATDLKDEKMANDVSKILIKAEGWHNFLALISKDDEKKLYACILNLIKLTSDPKPLLNSFKDALHTTQQGS